MQWQCSRSSSQVGGGCAHVHTTHATACMRQELRTTVNSVHSACNMLPCHCGQQVEPDTDTNSGLAPVPFNGAVAVAKHVKKGWLPAPSTCPNASSSHNQPRCHSVICRGHSVSASTPAAPRQSGSCLGRAAGSHPASSAGQSCNICIMYRLLWSSVVQARPASNCLCALMRACAGLADVCCVTACPPGGWAG